MCVLIASIKVEMDRKQLKVSVIVPVYNVGKYLDRCVRSLGNQTLHGIEIMLVDDRRLDECLAV